MDKKNLHEVENFLQQIISHSEYVSQMENCPDLLQYITKIKYNAHKIEAIISDACVKKQKVHFFDNSFEVASLDYLVGMKVMIVDDIDENILIMKNIFQIFSCEIASAKSGEKAIEIYKNGFTPDIVCMDILMPGIDGPEATRQLKALGSKAFFVAVSALKNHSCEMSSVFNAWLSKPFTMEQIVVALQGCKITTHTELEKKDFLFLLDISDNTKDELLKYVRNGTYTALETLIKKLPNTQAKEFLQNALKKMDFDSIQNCISYSSASATSL